MPKTRVRIAAVRGPRWRRRKEARAEELVAAALDAFVEHGYAATRLEDVARRAGVTKGTIYLYFRSKDALFKAVVRQTIIPHLELGERMLAAHEGDAAELVGSMLRQWWEWIGKTKLSGIPKLVMAEATHFPELARFYHNEVVVRGTRLFGEVLQRGIVAGEFRPLHVPSAVRLAFAPLVLTAVQQHSIHRCIDERIDVPEYLEHHIDIFLRGISAHGPRSIAHA